MQFDIQEAKIGVSKLVAAVERDETVTICRNGRPVIACVPAPPHDPFPFAAWGIAAGRGGLVRSHSRTDRRGDARRYGALMLLDTHVLIWAMLVPGLLSGPASDALASASLDGQPLRDHL